MPFGKTVHAACSKVGTSAADPGWRGSAAAATFAEDRKSAGDL